MKTLIVVLCLFGLNIDAFAGLPTSLRTAKQKQKVMNAATLRTAPAAPAAVIVR